MMEVNKKKQRITILKSSAQWDSYSEGTLRRIFVEMEKGVYLIVFSASSPEMERKACRLIYGLYPGRIALLFVATMIVNGYVFPNKATATLLMEYGERKCKEQFGCWPLLEIPNSSPLKNIDPKFLSLYGYLAPLSRKKNYTVENTPQMIRNFFGNTAIKNAYSALTDFGLLDRTAPDTWTHSDKTEAKECRELMTQAVTVEKFFYDAERKTWSIKEDIEQCEERGYKLISRGYPDGRFSPCPICHLLPGEEVELPLDASILQPFHYKCARAIMISNWTYGKRCPQLGEVMKKWPEQTAKSSSFICETESNFYKIGWEGATLFKTKKGKGLLVVPFEKLKKIVRVSELDSRKVHLEIVLKTGKVIPAICGKYSRIFNLFAKDMKQMVFEQKSRSKKSQTHG